MSKIKDTEEISEGTFPINLKLIAQYQQTELILVAKYEYGMYHKGYFCGGSNIDLNLIMCEDNIFIPSKLQSYVLPWYHLYLLYPVMDIMEAIIRQHL